MRIVVLSDTHLQNGQSLPPIVWNSLSGIDLILHAGDVVTPGLLSDLGVCAPVRAVRGNCDGWELANLPVRDIIDCDGLRVGLIHGNAGSGESTPERAYWAFASEGVRAVVFGHSHSPYLQWHNGILLFNPGSPTSKRRQPRYSFGILEIENNKVTGRHIYF